MKAAVVVFPDSNGDRDAKRALDTLGGGAKFAARFVWHKETSIEDFDLIVLPGGFTFGDYLRTGAIARYSPVMKEVVRQAGRGTRILGICNGFQILTEAGLLPGALLRNRDLLFLGRDVWLKVENDATPFTNAYAKGQVIRLPIAHGDGNYFIDDEGYKKLEGEGRIVLRYCAPDGKTTDGRTFYSPNGAKGDVAGIVSEKGNVLGLMPHPERLVDPILGGGDGRGVFDSLLNALEG
ncbi:MAG: phosphoribosylformylglycinamidine synthase subunit PurQ [Synergistaceae bacterium]|jgi:phosphoribosylformylglycinamidine synthase|nr:phosphoribosylformylglycinamidine synthase subunit PurQ [Synergistaceae bacterium]